MRGGVAIAADDRHAWLRKPLLRTDDVHDSLLGGFQIVKADAEILAILFHLIQLRFADGIEHGQITRRGRCAVIHGGNGQIRPAHFETAFP